MHPQAELAAIFGVDLNDPPPNDLAIRLQIIIEAMRALSAKLARENS